MLATSGIVQARQATVKLTSKTPAMASRDYRHWPLALLLLMLWIPCGAEITIQNNAYSGIVIAIEEGVDEDPNLLQGIRTAFTEASQFLYEITGNRAYFSSISILLPSSWSDSQQYGPSTGELYENSHFRILNDYPRYDTPSVFRPSTVCGETGGYGLFSPAHFTDSQLFTQNSGPYGKQIVYQWGRLRFGVFDERPQSGEPFVYPINQGESYEGSRCSLQIPGVIRSLLDITRECSIADLLNNLCIFVPDQQAVGTYASLMYTRTLDHVSKFCDVAGEAETNPSLVHNPVPTNAQNTRCSGRSVWEVIRDHPDYAEMDTARQVTTTVPTFRIIKNQNQNQLVPRLILVLDTSLSMAGARLQKLRQGVTYFLENVVPNDMHCGIVQFSGTASTLRDLANISPSTRPQFLAAVPVTGDGTTSIASGIAKALDMLASTGNTADDILVLVSDGKENTDPRIRDVYNWVLDSGVTIFTVAISDNADTGLEALAQSTGGNAYFAVDSDESNAITEAFLHIGNYLPITGWGDSAGPVTVLSVATSVAPNSTISRTVYIESTLGFNTKFTLDYASSRGVEFSLRFPGGRIYGINSDECTLDDSIQVISCAFPGNSMTGEWQYTVTNKDVDPQRVSIIVRSQPRDSTNPPIVARALWAITGEYIVVAGTMQRIFATVSRGPYAVLGANVSAIVESDTSTVVLTLMDDGAGADLNSDDGIYSRFFTNFDHDGRYTVKVEVDGSDVVTTSLQTILGVPTPPNNHGRQKRSPQATGKFHRVVSGGMFRAMGTVSLQATPYPPGRITDLRVISTDISSLHVTLQWTAQGAVLDLGTAVEYEIRRGFQRNLSVNYNIVMATDVVQGDLSSPADSGTKEKFIIQLPTGENTYFLAVVPKVASATAPISNVVPVSIRSTAEGLGGKPAPPRISPWKIGLIIGVLVVCVTTAVIAVCFSKKGGLFRLRQARSRTSTLPVVIPSKAAQM